MIATSTWKKTLARNTSMLALFNSYFFKTIFGPILSLLFPPILLIIMGHILKLEYVFPGIVAFCSMLITVQIMPLGLIEMKNSTLFKYIGSSPLSSRTFIVVIILYYVFINIVSIMLLMITAMIFFKSQVFTGHAAGLFSGILTPTGGISFFIANLLHTILGLSIGIAISTFAKTPQQALAVGLLVVFPSMFLSGMVVTVDIIAQSKAMTIISYFMPFKYTTANIIISATPTPQVGDFLDLLRLDENNYRSNSIFAALFNDGTHAAQNGAKPFQGFDAEGHLWYRGAEIKNTDELLRLYDMNKANGALDINFFHATNGIVRPESKELFEIIFIKGRDSVSVASDNNIFLLNTQFGVRRVPDITSIKSLIQDWLDQTYGQTGNGDKMTGILDAIKRKDWAWMDLFMKQSSVVYQIYDRSLNLFLPVVLCVGLQWYSIKNFKWTSR